VEWEAARAEVGMAVAMEAAVRVEARVAV